MWMLENAFLIPLIPAISFVIIMVLGKKTVGKDRVHFIGIAAVGLVWAMSLVAAFQWTQRIEDPPEGAVAVLEDKGHGDEHGDDHSHDGDGDHHDEDSDHGDDDHSAPAIGGGGGGSADGVLAVSEGDGEQGYGGNLVKPVISTFGSWWSNAGVDFAVGTHVDGQTALLLVVVTTISLLVHIYSTEYVKGDRRYVHYFGFLSLFTASTKYGLALALALPTLLACDRYVIRASLRWRSWTSVWRTSSLGNNKRVSASRLRSQRPATQPSNVREASPIIPTSIQGFFCHQVQVLRTAPAGRAWMGS